MELTRALTRVGRQGGEYSAVEASCPLGGAARVKEALLAGWTIQGYDAAHPEQTFTYHTFAAGTLAEARIARIYGGLAGGPTDTGVDLYFGGSGGMPSVSGVVLQLVDPQGIVRHELAVLPGSSFTPAANLAVLPNADGTKAFVLPTSGSLDNGYWQFKLAFARQADADLPVLSVGGESADAEEAAARFGAYW